MTRSKLWPKPAHLWILAVILLSRVSTLPVQTQEKSGSPVHKYNGSGSCSSSGCHGGAQITDIGTRQFTSTHIWQNEAFTWSTQDPHFKAFSTLETKRSTDIYANLKRRGSPKDDEQCLGCHALKPERQLQARLVFPEGVSCESCHGPSSDWFESHFQHHPNWGRCPSQTNTAESIDNKHGMYPIRGAAKRLEQCAECHVGTAKYEVDHELIAAGHPDLLFELDLFSAKMPRHWATPNELHEVCDNVPKDSNYEVRLWAVGQAVQLRAVLDRLVRRTTPDPLHPEKLKWPEYSELDCFSCHHSVYSNALDPNYDRYAANSHPKGVDSWRQRRGYENRTAGSPPWNSAHYSIFRILVNAVDQVDSNDLETELNNLYRAASRSNSSAKEVRDQATVAAQTAATLVEKIAREFKPSAEANKPLLRKIMLNISAEVSRTRIANEDTRSAEQAYMALDSLFRSYAGIETGEPLDSPKTPHHDVGARIQALYQQFDNPSAYDAPRFTEALRQVHNALMNTNEVAAKNPSQGRVAKKLRQ